TAQKVYPACGLTYKLIWRFHFVSSPRSTLPSPPLTAETGDTRADVVSTIIKTVALKLDLFFKYNSIGRSRSVAFGQSP
ncbi:MAG: hypothetical protein ACRC2R_11015, partial [Xenococcaceae cyanobacterium]